MSNIHHHEPTGRPSAVGSQVARVCTGRPQQVVTCDVVWLRRMAAAPALISESHCVPLLPAFLIDSMACQEWAVDTDSAHHRPRHAAMRGEGFITLKEEGPNSLQFASVLCMDYGIRVWYGRPTSIGKRGR
jgi:hypothetical protein